MRRVLLSLVGLALPSVLMAQASRSTAGLTEPVLGFGTAVAVSGDMVLVGRPGIVPNFPMPPSQTGSVHVFRRGNDGRWVESGSVTARDVALGDGVGSALAVDGTLLAVAAPDAMDHKGVVYLYQRGGNGQWTEQARLSVSDGASGDRLGASLAMAGGMVLAGMPGRNGEAGSVVVFQRGASGWTEAARLTGQGAAAGDRFGAALSLQGDRLLVGAPGPAGNDPAQTRAGAGYLFRRNGAAWGQEARLVPADTSIRGAGTAVLLAMGEALVSAPGGNRGAGLVLRFQSSGNGWSQAGELKAAVPERPSFFGTALAADGHDLLVGAPFSGSGVGALYVLRHDPATGTYTEVQKLTTRGVGIGTQLGAAVAAGGGVAVAGAPLADFFEGSGFVYRKEGAEWREAGTVSDTLGNGLEAVTGGEVRCENGKVRGFDCGDADLVSFLPASAIGARRGIMINDMWGWTDPETQREFAIVGRFDGTSFIEVTDPAHPVFLGDLPLHEGAHPNLWRDIKVYKGYAFIVADNAGPHGMQVFDLRQLRDVRNPPVTFSESAHYDRMHSAHNIVINESTGFAYTVGNSMGGETCGGALHMIDIRDPLHPKFAGCYGDPTTGFAKTGYTHDAQCVTYQGPDSTYRGHEICFNASETAVGIADVTDKANPKPLATIAYPNVAYAHQGWLSDDQRYFFLDDEGDELSGTAPTTRTLVFDVSDLDDPVLAKEFFGTTPASDHNLYVRGNYMYQSDYVAGLRIVDISDPTNPREVGYFDTVPYGVNQAGFAGSWSNYPFFKSGVVGVTSMREGFFLVRFRPKAPIP